MRRPHRHARALAMLMTLLCGVTAGGCDDSMAKSRLITKADSGTTISIDSGAALLVTLDANPTTGFDWHVVKNDSTVLKQEGERAYKAFRNIPGSPGKETFRFLAVKKGSSLLEMACFRSWEHDVAPIDSFSVQVTAK